MLKKLLIIFGFLFCTLSAAYSIVSDPFDCKFERSNIISVPGFSTLFSTSANLSAHFSTELTGYPSIGEGYEVRCNANNINEGKGGKVSFKIIDKPESVVVCEKAVNELMYFTDSTTPENRRVSRSYDESFHTKVLCANFAKSSGVMDLVWTDEDYSSRGYSCLFKTNDVNNGLASHCDAKFNGSKEYKYTVWGILYDSIDSLNCKADCSSKLDNRIYSICSEKLPACSNVPFDCDGSLYGSWVKYLSDPTVQNTEVQCSAPWNKYRSSKFTDLPLQITTADNKCDNLIKIEYPFILDDEQIKMSIYVCSD
jgi:hypothetical protein